MTETERQAQRVEALQMGLEARRKAMQVKIQIAAGSTDPVAVIRAQEVPVQAYKLLRSVRGIGVAKAERILTQANVSRLSRIDRISAYSANRLADVLEAKLAHMAEVRATRVREGRA